MKKGFTLVELSIVLVIIGLLIGGVLIGQGLIESAKNLQAIREIQSFQILYDRFQEIYRQRPGDFNNRIAMFGRTANGNNNNLIEWNLAEGGHFWRDLGDSGLLEINDPNSFGYYRPYLDQSKLNFDTSRYFASNSDLYPAQNDGGIPTGVNNIALVSMNSGSQWLNRVGISAMQLASIDRKIDDSLPRSGILRGNSGYTETGGGAVLKACAQDSGGTFQYKVEDEERNCRMFLMLD